MIAQLLVEPLLPVHLQQGVDSRLQCYTLAHLTPRTRLPLATNSRKPPSSNPLLGNLVASGASRRRSGGSAAQQAAVNFLGASSATSPVNPKKLYESWLVTLRIRTYLANLAVIQHPETLHQLSQQIEPSAKDSRSTIASTAAAVAATTAQVEDNRPSPAGTCLEGDVRNASLVLVCFICSYWWQIEIREKQLRINPPVSLFSVLNFFQCDALFIPFFNRLNSHHSIRTVTVTTPVRD